MRVKEVCRLCLVDANEGMKSVFSKLEKASPENSETIADTVFMLFGVKINEHDVYSHLICDRCHQKVTVCMHYRKKFQKNQIVLRKKHYEQTKSKDQISSKDSDDVIVIETDPIFNLEDALSLHNSTVHLSEVSDSVVLEDDISFIMKPPSWIADKDKEEVSFACGENTAMSYISVPIEYLNAVCPFVELSCFTDAVKNYKQLTVETYKEENLTSSPSLNIQKNDDTKTPAAAATETENVFCTIKSVSVLVCEHCSRSFKSQLMLEFHCRRVHNLQDSAEILDKRKKVRKLKKNIHVNNKPKPPNRPQQVIATQNKFNKGRLVEKMRRKLYTMKNNVKNLDSNIRSKTNTNEIDPLDISAQNDNEPAKKRRGRPIKVKKTPLVKIMSNDKLCSNSDVHPEKRKCDNSDASDLTLTSSASNEDMLRDNLDRESERSSIFVSSEKGINSNSFHTLNNDLSGVNTVVKKKRGRPRKLVSTIMKPSTNKKRGRPRKQSNESSISREMEISNTSKNILSCNSDEDVFPAVTVFKNVTGNSFDSKEDSLNSSTNGILKNPSKTTVLKSFQPLTYKEERTPIKNLFNNENIVSKVTPTSTICENQVILSDSSDSEADPLDLSTVKNMINRFDNKNESGKSLNNKVLLANDILNSNRLVKGNQQDSSLKNLISNQIRVTNITPKSSAPLNEVILMDSSDSESEKEMMVSPLNVSKDLLKEVKNNKSKIFCNINNLKISKSKRGRPKKLSSTNDVLSTSKQLTNDKQGPASKNLFSGEISLSRVTQKVQIVIESEITKTSSYSLNIHDNLAKKDVCKNISLSQTTEPLELIDVDHIVVEEPMKNLPESDPLDTVKSDYTTHFGSSCPINSMIESQTHQINHLKTIVEHLQESSRSSGITNTKKNDVIDLT